MSHFLHCIALKFNNHADPGISEKFFAEARAAALSQTGCVSAFAGAAIAGGQDNWAGALVAVFESEEDYRSYMVSEEHRALALKYGHLILDKASTQFVQH